MFIFGCFLVIVGFFMIANEALACEYERSNLGPVVLIVGIVIIIGGVAEYVW